MAKGKRIALCVPPDIDAVITRLSKLTNTPKTAIVTDLLINTVPVMVGVIEAIEQTKLGQQELAINALAQFLGDAQSKVNQMHFDLGEWKGKQDAKT